MFMVERRIHSAKPYDVIEKLCPRVVHNEIGSLRIGEIQTG